MVAFIIVYIFAIGSLLLTYNLVIIVYCCHDNILYKMSYGKCVCISLSLSLPPPPLSLYLSLSLPPLFVHW